jgi:hypothetical protein
MASALTTITNISNQNIPVLVDEVPLNKANPASDVSPATALQMQITPGSQVTLESRRLDLGQLEQLRRKGLITFQVT